MNTNDSPSPADRTSADELRAIADDLDALGPDYPAMSSVTVYIQPPESEAADEVKAYVDDVAVALLGKPGETRETSSGVYHHTITGSRGSVQVSVFRRLPMPDPKDAEIERLRSENAALRAKPTGGSRLGFTFSREADDPTPGAVPTGVDGHPEYTGRAPVPDMQTRPRCSPECRDSLVYNDDEHLDTCPVVANSQNGGE